MMSGQGAPSTTRCIKTVHKYFSLLPLTGQGAPSTIRCIKTAQRPTIPNAFSPVREHPAPSGALRPHDGSFPEPRAEECVRERPVPSGALRREHALRGPLPEDLVREHPAPPGALRRGHVPVQDNVARPELGDTQHHQVRSIPCSRRPGCGPQSKCQRVEAGRRCGGASRGRAVSAPPVPFYPVMRTQGTRIRQRRSHTRAESSRCARCCVA